MRFHKLTPAGLCTPGHVATALVLLLAVLSGAGSPFAGRPSALAAGFEPARELAALARRSGYLGVVAERPGLLSSAQLARAVTLHGRLPAGQRADLDRLLTGAPPAIQGYLVQGFAAGHSVEELTGFAAVIARHGPGWLTSRLRPVDPTETGPVEFRGNTISQYNDTTCGSTVIVAAHAMVDPVYALGLTTGGRPETGADADESFVRRLRDEEQRVHNETDRLWPQIAGTPPWGVSQHLDGDPAGLGAPYSWVAVMPGMPARADQIIRQALAAVDRGYPVPLLIGHVIPRHYVLLVRHDAGGAFFYEPTAGEIIRVPARDLAHRDFGELGFPDLLGAILPSGSTPGAAAIG